MEHVAARYWYPLYSYVRRCGYSPEDGTDLVQSFFEHLLSSDLVAKANPGQGQFRSFLLASLRNHLNSNRKRDRAQKRGGGEIHWSIHTDEAERRYSVEPAHHRSPDVLFERTWALNLIEQAFRLMEGEFSDVDKFARFKRLQSVLFKHDASRGYAEIARELGMSEGAVKVTVHRMRHRFREILRGLVASTVQSPAEVDSEMRHLLAVLREE